jgi:hypothetical protein
MVARHMGDAQLGTFARKQSAAEEGASRYVGERLSLQRETAGGYVRMLAFLHARSVTMRALFFKAP